MLINAKAGRAYYYERKRTCKEAPGTRADTLELCGHDGGAKSVHRRELTSPPYANEICGRNLESEAEGYGGLDLRQHRQKGQIQRLTLPVEALLHLRTRVGCLMNTDPRLMDKTNTEHAALLQDKIFNTVLEQSMFTEVLHHGQDHLHRRGRIMKCLIIRGYLQYREGAVLNIL